MIVCILMQRLAPLIVYSFMHVCMHSSTYFYTQGLLLRDMPSARSYKYNEEQGKDLGLRVEIKKKYNLSNNFSPEAFKFFTLSLAFENNFFNVVKSIYKIYCPNDFKCTVLWS